MLHIVAGRVDHYSAQDSLLWTSELPDTLRTPLRERLFGLTRQDTTPSGFAFPNVFAASRPVGDTLWILLRGGPPAHTLLGRLDPAGGWLPPLTIAGTGMIATFALDPRHRRLYLLDRDEGTIVWVPLP